MTLIIPEEFKHLAESPRVRPLTPVERRGPFLPMLTAEDEPTAEQVKTEAVQRADTDEIERTSVREWDPGVVRYLFDTYGSSPVPRGRPFQATTGIGGTRPQLAPYIVERATTPTPVLGAVREAPIRPQPVPALTGLGGIRPQPAPLTRISPLRAKATKKVAFANEDVFASNAEFDEFMEQAETMGSALKEGFEQARTKFTASVQRPRPPVFRDIAPAPEGPAIEFGSELGGPDIAVDPREFEHIASPAIESIKRKGIRIKDETIRIEGLRDEMVPVIDLIADAFTAAGLNPPVMTDAKTQRNVRTFHDLGLGVDFRWKDLDATQQKAVMVELDKWAPRGKTKGGSPIWSKDGYQIIIHKEAGNEVHLHVEYDTPETKAELNKYAKGITRRLV